ncbi:hypothetical protein CTEN210_12633 [Chaetoceros tenuissimus]|uniref:Sulfotransferase domain-containing protein n=1 Tax=Chaetoceros tenuissimus TaxID=426638 RepID=A0AAD3D1J7_9STRA|nr:hypothetical protein CTEN210_12633 [Chaetoceros tenuissimus]
MILSKSKKALLLLALTALACTRFQTSQLALHRLLSSSYETCDISTISLPSQPILPVYSASYPGSGAQMSHYLYEALTGIESGDEWLHRGDTYDHVTIKTHYPARVHQIEGSRLMQRVILLIRSPMHALPSYHSYLWEKEQGLPDHTQRAPEETWIKWRNENFAQELTSWKNHLLYWMHEFEKEDRLVVSYERLVDPKQGPVESTRIANFLGRTEGVETLPPSQIPCVWDKVVNYKRVELDQDGNEISEEEGRKLNVNRNLYDDHGKVLAKNVQDEKAVGVKRRVKYVSHEDPSHPTQSLRDGKRNSSFTKEQLESMKSTINALRARFLSEYTLVVILTSYMEEIENELKLKL